MIFKYKTVILRKFYFIWTMTIGSPERLYIFKSFSCVCFLAVVVTQSGCALFSKDRDISSKKPTYSQNESEGKILEKQEKKKERKSLSGHGVVADDNF
jgi:hypothetical protein